MARLSPFRAGLALFVIFVIAYAAAAEDKCRSGCQGTTPQNFKYAEGTTYKYNLESNIDISLSSAEGQQSSTKLKATVLLTQQPQCNQLLKLQNVQIIGADGKKYGGIPDLDKPIRINAHDGHIEDMICAEVGDNQNSLNIKRAVASLFQSAMKDHYETDVFGVCPTEFHYHKEGNVLTVTKSRSLNRCSHRENVKHDFMTTAFNIHSEIKSSPILKSDYTAEQRIKDGILDHVLVTENYLYLPFSIGKNGAKATVQTKLQLAGKSKDAGKSKCSEPKSIIFENPHPVISQKADVSSILHAVKDAANSIGVTVGDKTANKFSELIKVLGASKKDDLLAVYNQVRSGAGFNDKVVAKRVFLDALFRAGTGECTEVAIELLKNKELSALETKMVYLGMAFIRHATPESIQAAAALLDMPNLSREAYLGIGTMVHRYCSSHSCKNVDQVNKLTQKLISKLKDGKATNKKQEEEIISVLKALTNMQHLVDSAIPKITAIAQDKKAPSRVRVAALEAYRADPCKDKLRDSAISILKDIQQDSEIRIKAYLALAECPNGKVATAIKTILDNEPSYQVGGFIVSHIRNLRASANPDKALAKRELANVNTMKRFPIDPRKYSFNTELSYAFDTLGLSTSAENNVIYSQNSFLPRSACLNLTTEVFGHKINFLEIDTRQENLDKVMEHYFGPLGYLRNTDPKELIASGKVSAEKIIEHLKTRYEKTRGKRQVSKADLDAIAKQIHIKTNELNTDLDIDLSVKVLGSEMMFMSMSEDITHFSPDVFIDKIFDALDSGIDKIKQFDHTFRSNMVFIDAELRYPTSMGFPLKIAVEATATTQLKTSGALDIHAFMGKRQDTVVKLSMIPSSNIEVTGRLVIDAAVVESGLKVVSNMYTATGGAAELELYRDIEGFDIKFNLPIEKQEIIQAKHDVVFTCRDAGVAEHDTPIKFIESKDFSICLDQLNALIGLTACADINGPNYQVNQGPILPFPLSGNSKFSVSIQKENPMTYHIRDVVYDGPKKGFEFVMEAISEKSPNEKVSFVVEGFLTPEAYIKATLDSPIKKAILEGRVIDSDKEKSLSGKFQHDNHEYSGKFGVAISGSDAKATYTPLIEYKTPEAGVQKSPYTVEGTIDATKNGDNVKYTFNNVKLVAPNTAPIQIAGNLGKENGEYNCDVTVSDNANSASLKGHIKVEPSHAKFDVEMKNTLSPMSNFHINYDLKKQDKALTSDMSIAYGGDLSSKITLHNYLLRKYENAESYKFATKNKLSAPVLGIEAQVDFKKEPKMVEYDVEGKYNNMKLGSEMKLNYNKKAQGDYDFEFEMHGFDNKIKADAKREVTGDKSKVESTLEVNNKKTEVKGTLTHKMNPNDLHVGAQLVFTGFVPEPVTMDYNYEQIPNDVKTHMKISRPSIVYIDYDLHANEKTGATGHLAAEIPGIVKANGEIKAENWNGKAFMVFDLVKIQRKVKFDSAFHLADPKYDVSLTMYPNFEKDDKKIVITSNNHIEATSIDSKNSIDAFGNKLEVNTKGSLDGTINDGKLVGEVEVTLPNEVYFIGKVNREMHLQNGVGSGKAYLNTEVRKNKNTPGRKMTLNAVGNVIDMKDDNYDITYNLVMDDSHGKTINGDVHFKASHKKEGDCSLLIKSKVHGSAIEHPLELDLATTITDDLTGTYDLKMSAGPSKFNLNGKYDISGEEKPLTSQSSLLIESPSPLIQKMEMKSSLSFLKNDDNLELTETFKLYFKNAHIEQPVDFTTDEDLKMSKHNGQYKASIKYHDADPINIALSYGHKDEEGVGKCHCDVSVTYAKGKNIKGELSVVHPNQNEWKIDGKLDTPFEAAKSTQVHHFIKKSEDGKQIQSDLDVTVDGKKYIINKNLIVSDIAPLFKFELTHPDGKVDKLYAKANNPGSKNFAAEFVVAYTDKDFLFDSSVDAHVQSVEDFSINIKLDSPKLNMDKIVFEAKNKQNKAAKIIEMQATANGKNLLKGSTTYKVRDEGAKYIVEGSGEFTVQEAKKSGNFKFIRHNLNQDKNGEQGVELSFDAGLGSKAIDSELKITNKQFRLSESYCEEKKQCAHFEIDSKTNIVDVTEYNHELEVNVDLRKLGLSHEFGLKAVTKRKNFIIDHTVDVHFQTQENNKYQYSLYLHPKEAGVSLTTPKRQVSLEGHVTLQNKGKGPIKAELAMYLNKKAEPNKKTALSGSIEYIGDEKVGEIKALSKFTTPGLAKDLSVTYNCKHNLNDHSVEFTLVMDVFNKPNNKIVVSGKENLVDGANNEYSLTRQGTIKSTGMNIDISYNQDLYKINSAQYSFEHHTDLKINLDGKKKHFEYLAKLNQHEVREMIKLDGKTMYDFDQKMNINQDSQIIDGKYQLYGLKPVVSHFELKNFNTLKFTIGHQDKPDTQLAVSSAFIPGQIADFRVSSGNKELIKASVQLDETNFLKHEYGISTEDIKSHVLDPVQAEVTNMIAEEKKFAEHYTEEMTTMAKTAGEVAKKNIPNLKPAADYYKSEMHKLKEEIVSDKTIKEISETMSRIFGSMTKAVGEIMQKINEFVTKTMDILKTNFTKVCETFENEFIPKMKEYFKKQIEIMQNIAENVTQIIFTIFGKINEFISSHQEELKQLATTFSAIAQDVGRFFYKNYELTREMVVDYAKKIYEEIKALPIYEELKTRYEMVFQQVEGWGEPMINIIRDTLTTLRDMVPNEDFKKLVDSVSDYLEKKMRHEKVNDIAVLQKIFAQAITTVKNLFSQINFKGMKIMDPSDAMVNYFTAIPKLVAAKISPLNYFLDGDIPTETLKQSLYEVSFNPRSWMPPFRMYAFLVQGQHVFTFDGKHITFPGKCNYLLARDAVNGNFSIAGTYTNGLLTAITLADKTDSITFKKGGQAMINKDASELPIRRPHLEAIRLYDSVYLISKAGVRIMCDPELVTCTFSISGFYHGQLRGLLGNGNNEPYDDFTMPNGKIVTSESDFGNAYKMGAACPAVKTVDHKTHQHAPSCTELFDSSSLLAICYPFVNVDNFRTACDHGVAAGVKDTELAIVKGYVAACHAKYIPVIMPDEYLKCHNSDQPRSIGDKFSVKLPGKAADIVIIVEQNKENEGVYKELVQPVVAEMIKELAAKGITDVELHLIGFSKNSIYPSHFTNGGKLSWKGKLPTVKFEEDHKPEEHSLHFIETLQGVAHELSLTFGINSKAFSIYEALKYPFRVHAAKTIIAFFGNQCEHGTFVLIQRLRSYLYPDNITPHVVLPIRGLQTTDPKMAKQVIGFDEEHVITFADAKKHPDGRSENYKDFDYDDYCAEGVVFAGGHVFNLDAFNSAKGPAKKQFIASMTHNVLDKMVNQEVGLDCECEYVGLTKAQNECNVAYTKQINKH